LFRKGADKACKAKGGHKTWSVLIGRAADAERDQRVDMPQPRHIAASAGTPVSNGSQRRGALAAARSMARGIDLHTNKSPDSVASGARVLHARDGNNGMTDATPEVSCPSFPHLSVPQLTGNDRPPCVGNVLLCLSERPAID